MSKLSREELNRMIHDSVQNALKNSKQESQKFSKGDWLFHLRECPECQKAARHTLGIPETKPLDNCPDCHRGLRKVLTSNRPGLIGSGYCAGCRCFYDKNGRLLCAQDILTQATIE